MFGSQWVRGLSAVVFLLSANSASAIVNPAQSAPAGIRESRQIQVNNWYTLDDGMEISVISFSRDGRRVKIGIDNGLSEPSIEVVALEALQGRNPKRIDFEALEGLADLGLIVETVATRGGMTYCLRDVRLRARSFTAQRNIPQGIPQASQAYPKYRAKGWKPITYSARVPNGTACFFGGGRLRGCSGGGCGHAAIKIGPNKWLGAGITPTPYLRNRNGNGRVPYKFHGCLTPP